MIRKAVKGEGLQGKQPRKEMFAMVLFAAAGIVLLYAVFKIFVYNTLIHPLLIVDGPKALYSHLGLGNLPKILKTEFGEILLTYLHQQRQLGFKRPPMIRQTTLFNQPALFILDSGSISYILGNPDLFPKAPLPMEFEKVFGNGLLLSHGEEWKRQRKMLNPAFTLSRIKEFLPIFSSSARQLTNLWSKGGETDIHQDMTHTTFDIIGESAFDFQFAALETSLLAHNPSKQTLSPKEEAKLREQEQMRVDNHTLTEAFSFNPRNLFRFIFPRVAAVIFPKHQATMDSALDRINSTVENIVASKKEQLKNSEVHPKDLLSMIIKDNDSPSTDTELRDQCMNILLAGHDTTSLAVTYTLYLLASHPRVQNKLREELQSAVWVKEKRQATMEEINALPYLHAVFKESLRIHPPAPVLFERRPIRDVELNGIKIPKGSPLIISPLIQGMNPDIFPDPKEFIPERWLADFSPSPADYMPFSTGARICIGLKFAQLEMKILLNEVVSKFEYELVDGFSFKKSLQITWRPVPTLNLNVTPIQEHH